jgi:membrane protein implicated in regulation of membrane protease activity
MRNKRKYWILAIVATALIVGCVIWEMMALIVSIVAVLVYSLIIALFVYPSFETINDQDGK